MYYINIYINLGIFVAGGFFVAGLFWLYIKNPEKFERLFYHLYKILSLIPLIRKKYVYKRIATSIQADINTGGEIINRQAPGVLPHAMKIEWAKNGQDVETYLRNGEVIVKISPKEDNDHNIVVSTLAYLKKGLLPHARHCLDETLIQATDFTVAKEVFTIAKRKSAVSYFITNYLEPEISSNPNLGEDCSDLDVLNDVGIFSRILLKQLEFLGKKLFATTPTAIIHRETRDFKKFLLEIAKKKDNAELLPKLDYMHPRIRVRVLLIAKEETKQWGMKPYINRIKEAQYMSFEYLYICAWGKENIAFAESIARGQEKAGRLSILSRSSYICTPINRNAFPAIYIVAAINIKTSPMDILSSAAVIRSLLEENVKELREGKVEVVALAREPGKMSMIVVKPLIEGLNAVQCFVEATKTEQFKVTLDQEELHVLPWQDDPQLMLATALLGSKKDKITDIEFNNYGKTARVIIEDNDARKMAVGRSGINVRLVSILTGWHIDIRQGKSTT